MFAFERAVRPGLLGREPLKRRSVIAPNVRALFYRRTLHVSALEPIQLSGHPAIPANDGPRSRCHNSALAQWYRARTEGPAAARRTKMIVALARKLLIAFWRMVTVGEIPVGFGLRQPT
jgi:hypothetical protein